VVDNAQLHAELTGVATTEGQIEDHHLQGRDRRVVADKHNHDWLGGSSMTLVTVHNLVVIKVRPSGCYV
jgi:hypothetical protein